MNKTFLTTSIALSATLLLGTSLQAKEHNKHFNFGEKFEKSNQHFKKHNRKHSNKLPKNYNEYKSGIISADTLDDYIKNWNMEDHDGGKLIIVQAGSTSDGQFLQSQDERGVYVYPIGDEGACDPSYMRHDGFSQNPAALLSGAYTNGMINQFNMNPEKDFVVFAVGKSSTGMRGVVRSYWVLKYWGWDESRLGFLNGSVSYNYQDKQDKLGSVTPYPTSFTNYTMQDAKNKDGAKLHIYLKDMMDIAAKDDKKGYFIADSRGTSEYNGEVLPKSVENNCGVSGTEQCYGSFRGHIRGATDVPYTDFLIMDDQKGDINGDGIIDSNDSSFKFQKPRKVKRILKQKGYKKGDKIITYCRTGRKATLLNVLAMDVLKAEVQMFDGSWMQWGQMSNSTDVNGNQILPDDSIWRTDTDKYSVNLGYTDSLSTQSKDIFLFNLDATTSDAIHDEDVDFLNN